MANTLRFKRGLASGIPTAVAGEPLFTTDTFDLYIGNGTTNTRFQKYIASGTTSQLLRGDGSLLTMPIVLTSPSNGQVLKFNGTNWVNDSDAGITGSGAAGQVAYFTGATTQGGSNNLFWDTTNLRLGVGLNNPSERLHVNGRILNQSGFILNRGDNLGVFTGASDDLGIYHDGTNSIISNSTGALIFNNPSERARITTLGNLHIGTFTSDSGEKLQVIGDTLLRGSGNTSATTALTVQNSDGTNMFRVRNEGAILIGSAGGVSPYIAGATGTTIFGASQRALAFVWNGGISTRINPAFYFTASSNIDWPSSTGDFIQTSFTFNPTSGTGVLNTHLIQPTINQTGGANGITRGLYVNPTLTAAADWRSIEWSNNTGWGLYGAGTANNFLSGDTQIGTGALTSEKLQVNGTMKVTGAVGRTLVVQTNTDNNLVLTTTNSAADTYSLYENSADANNAWAVGRGNDGLFRINHSTGATYGAGTTTNRLLIDASGNLGLGVTPNTWSAAWKALQIQTASFAALSSQYTFVGQNFYNDGTSKFIGNGRAALYQQYDGVHSWYYTANNTSGAGAATTFTQAMTLTAAGRLLLNQTSDTGEQLQVTGTAKITGATTLNSTLTLSSTASSFIVLDNTTATTGRQWRASAAANGRFFLTNVTDAIDVLTIQTSGAATFSSSVTAASGIITGNLTVDTNTLFVDATNNRVGVLTTTPASAFQIGGTAGNTGVLQYTITSASPVSNQLLFGTDGTGYQFAIGKNQGGTISNLVYLQDNGNLGVGISPAYRLDVSGSARVSDAIAIGTTPDTNNPFKILKNLNTTVGIKFENTNTSSLSFSAVQLGNDITGGTAFTNLVYGSSGITESGVYKPSGTALINTGSGGLNFLAVSQPIRFFTSTGNGTERVRIKNEGHVRFVPLSAAPTTNVEAGDVYYDSTTNKLRCYNGTSWNDLF